MGKLTSAHLGKVTTYLLIFLFFMGIPLSPSGWSEDWQMSFNVSVPDPNADGGLLINRLEAGGLSTGTDLFDNESDVAALLAGPVQSAFTHEGETTYPGGLQLLWRDIRADGVPKTWKVKVASQQSSSPITLAWTTPPSIPSDTCHLGVVSLQDQTTGQWIDLNAASSYSYSSNGTVSSPEIRFFTLTVSSIPQNAPAIPTGLVSRSGSFNHSFFHPILLLWKGNSETDLAGYNVWRSLSSGSGYVRLTRVPTVRNQYVDMRVAQGPVYHYVITAVGKNGCESGFSKETMARAGRPTPR
ncbi:MAG: hypothetical protein HY203_11855 [Nitrospirae bacterium]|nr:hypothetical protein [Nitrospirota bacterium]